jgi:hypothetical protein
VIGNNALAIPLPDFDLLPSSYLEISKNYSYTAYWNKNNIILAQPLDVSVLLPLPSFIVINSDRRYLNFTLQTNEVSAKGNYTLVFVKCYESFSNALAFSSIHLSVMHDNWTSNTPPFFESALETQTIE